MQHAPTFYAIVFVWLHDCCATYDDGLDLVINNMKKWECPVFCYHSSLQLLIRLYVILFRFSTVARQGNVFSVQGIHSVILIFGNPAAQTP